MRRLLIFALFLLPPIVVSGCLGGGGGDFLVTEFKDGKAVGSYSTSSQPTDLSRDKIMVKVSPEGKLSWSVNVDNPSDKRGYCTGVLGIVTDSLAVIEVKFGSSVEAGSKDAPIGENDVAIKDLPAGWKVHSYNASVTPCAGCETPTTHVKGNWPRTPMSATYEVHKPAPVTKEVGEPAGIKLSAEIIQSDFTGKKFTAQVVAKSSLDKEVVMDLTLTFVGLDADDKPMVVGGKPVENKKETTLGVKAFSTSKERTVDVAFDVKVKSCEVHITGIKSRTMK